MELPTESIEPTAAPHLAMPGPQPFHNESLPVRRAPAGLEVHIRKETGWTIAVTFEDRALALLEARRLDATLRYSGVRILEEAFDEATGKTVTRTIFSSANANPHGTALPARRAGEIDFGHLDRSLPWTWTGLRFIPRRPDTAALATAAMVSGMVAGIVIKSIA